MKNQTSKEIAVSVLKAIFSTSDVKKLSKLRGVILCGYPGCGKSTIAELLVEAFSYERLSTDDIRTKKLFKGQNHRMASEHELVMLSRYKVYAELAKMVNKRLNDKKKVVVDGTHLDDKRFNNIGAMLAKLPSNKMAMVVIRTPEWVMKKRFMDWSKERYDQWWSVYDYWKKYVKKGLAQFPTKKELSNVQIIKPKRYAIRTFEWIPEIKAIVWDLDGTFYTSVKGISIIWNKAHEKAVAKKLNISMEKAEEVFWKRYDEIGSRTKSLDSFGIDGRKHIRELSEKTDYNQFLKKDLKMRKVIHRLKHVDQYIFTNSSMLGTEKKLKALGISTKLFKKIVASFDLKTSIKDEMTYKKVIKMLKLKPKEVLMIGDREKQDIIPARNVGMRTCMVWGTSKEADVSLKTVYEVAGLFGKEV